MEYFNEDTEIDVGDIKQDELYQLIDMDTNTLVETRDGKENCYLGYHYENLLPVIEKFVFLVVSTKKPAFDVSEDLSRRPLWMKQKRYIKKTYRLGQYFGLVRSFSEAFSPAHSFSPLVTLLFNCWSQLDLNGAFSNDPNRLLPRADWDLVTPDRIEADLLNILVERLRREYKKKNVNREKQRRKDKAKENYLSACRYIKALFERRSRLLVVRLDIGWGELAASCVNLEEVKKKFNKLMARRNGKVGVFRHLIGYVWKLEHSSLKRYHYHLMLFFDGSQVEKHSYLAEQIGIYWRDVITEGSGTYWNCNRDLNRYKRCGLGRVEYRDTIKRANLLYALSYLTKSEQYLMVKTSQKQRTFGKGEMPRERASAGRPRRTISE